MLFNRCIVYLKYSCTKKRAKNVQKRVKTCKNMQKRASQVLIHQKRASQVLIYQKTCKNVYLKRKISKNVLLKYFWTQFKIVHCQGPCSLRLCISRPYCISEIKGSCSKKRTKSLSLNFLLLVEKTRFVF